MRGKNYIFFIAFVFLFKTILFAEYGFLGNNYCLGGLGSATSYAWLPHNVLFNQTSAGTIEMWIYQTSSSTNGTLISKGSGMSPTFLWVVNSSTRLMSLKIGSTLFNNTGGGQIPLNQWTHVAVTWSGGPNFTVTFYINGNISANPVIQSAAMTINSDEVRIGGNQNMPIDYFSGRIDEVRFWNVARTNAQINDNRFIGLGDASGSNNNNALTGSTHYFGLVASWTFNRTTVNDDINNINGSYNGTAYSQFQDAGPIPYNFVLKCDGNSNDYARIPSNTIFNQSGDGTIELWFRANSMTNDQIIISKGQSPSTLSFAFGVNTLGNLSFRIGTNTVICNGDALATGRWYHLAVTWNVNGSYYDVKFYLNGLQNGTSLQLPNAFPTNNNDVIIGGSQISPNSYLNGQIDELRLYNPALTQTQLRENMFNSVRTFASNTALIAAYTFDGNLKNYSSNGSVIDASFNNGLINHSKLSAYLNENVPGAYSSGYSGYSTVINRTGNPNSFPQGFTKKFPFVWIPDNNSSGISDSIIVYNPITTVGSIEVFLSLKHPYVGNLIVTLTAPNGQTRNLTQNMGGSADNILSFFNDAFTNMPNSSTYFAPWGFLRPSQNFGTFNNATVNGTWKITVIDNSAGNIGFFEAWGLRFNNAVTVEQISDELPEKYMLYQNYPNPFNPSTTIRFSIPVNNNKNDNDVNVTLYDIMGREIKSMVNDKLEPGTYDIIFDGTEFSSGTYFYTLIINGEKLDTKKLVLLK